MGKVFVKGPVESPDDLLNKGPKLDAMRRGAATAGRNIAAAGSKAGEFLNSPYARMGGKLALGTAGVLAGGIKPANSFQEWFSNMVRTGKIAYDQINSKNAMDALVDRWRLEQESKNILQEQMRPARETRAYQELYERYGLSPQDVKQIYGKISPEDALNQERIVQQGLGRERRRSELYGQQGGEKSQAEQTAGELEAAADAVELPPYDIDTAIAPRALDLDEEVIQQEAAKINAQLQPAISNEELTQLMEPEKPQLMPDVEAIAAHPTTTAVPADNATAQINEVETAAHEEQKKHGMDHKAGMEPPKQEDEGEGEGGSQMQLIPPNAFGFENQQGQPPAPPGSVSAGPDALNDLNRLFGR